MSWIKEAAIFGKKLLFLAEQVQKNTEEIQSLRRDFGALQRDVDKLAQAIVRNRDKIGDFREWAHNRDEAT
jgi:chromosome segregation ATPase